MLHCPYAECSSPTEQFGDVRRLKHHMISGDHLDGVTFSVLTTPAEPSGLVARTDRRSASGAHPYHRSGSASPVKPSRLSGVVSSTPELATTPTTPVFGIGSASFDPAPVLEQPDNENMAVSSSPPLAGQWGDILQV